MFADFVVACCADIYGNVSVHGRAFALAAVCRCMSVRGAHNSVVRIPESQIKMQIFLSAAKRPIFFIFKSNYFVPTVNFKIVTNSADYILNLRV